MVSPQMFGFWASIHNLSELRQRCQFLQNIPQMCKMRKGDKVTIEKRKEIIDALMAEEIEVSLAKEKSYAGRDDTLANFKRIAERCGVSKYIVWQIYANKHFDSIDNAIKVNPDAPVDESEGLRGRIIDARNYLAILLCLLTEDKQSVKITAKIRER